MGCCRKTPSLRFVNMVRMPFVSDYQYCNDMLYRAANLSRTLLRVLQASATYPPCSSSLYVMRHRK